MEHKGYASLTSPTETKEWDTVTCCHCNRVVMLKKDPGGWCRRCMKSLCGPCADKGRCTPFEAKLDAYEKRMRFREQMEKA